MISNKLPTYSVGIRKYIDGNISLNQKFWKVGHKFLGFHGPRTRNIHGFQLTAKMHYFNCYRVDFFIQLIKWVHTFLSHKKKNVTNSKYGNIKKSRKLLYCIVAVSINPARKVSLLLCMHFSKTRISFSAVATKSWDLWKNIFCWILDFNQTWIPIKQ